MSVDNSPLLKQNFEKKAAVYDAFMLECIPDYSELLESLVDAIPFANDQALKICDLGCGTGNTTQLLSEAFPLATINCVDVSQMMIDMAKSKLDNDAITYQIADFNCFDFLDQYDIITSTFALHHLATDEDKAVFYKKIYAALKPDGIFINGDLVINTANSIEMHHMGLWKDWLQQFHTEEDLMETVIDRYYEEDRPTTTIKHLLMLQEIGFKDVDVVWKKLKGAVFYGFQ